MKVGVECYIESLFKLINLFYYKIMKKLKKIWQGFLRYFSPGLRPDLWLGLSHRLKRYSAKKRRFVIVLSLFLLLIIGTGLYYSIALARISDAEINLAALRENVNKQKICHEDCLLTRKKQAAIIVAALKKSEPNLLRRLEDYWNNHQESFEFKKEIINLWRLNNEANNDLSGVPPYIYDYLDQADGDPRLQSLIISSCLSFNQGKQWLDYYFNLLASKRDLSLKKEALIALSNRENKAADFNLKQLVFLKNLLINPATPLAIKADIVLLIGDYYPLFTAETNSILLEIYKNKALDNITRSFSGDILNRENGNTKLVLPAISEVEWENYYNY